MTILLDGKGIHFQTNCKRQLQPRSIRICCIIYWFDNVNDLDIALALTTPPSGLDY
jgi:hypothetical protein